MKGPGGNGEKHEDPQNTQITIKEVVTKKRNGLPMKSLFR